MRLADDLAWLIDEMVPLIWLHHHIFSLIFLSDQRIDSVDFDLGCQCGHGGGVDLRGLHLREHQRDGSRLRGLR